MGVGGEDGVALLVCWRALSKSRSMAEPQHHLKFGYLRACKLRHCFGELHAATSVVDVRNLLRHNVAIKDRSACQKLGCL